MKTKTLIVLVVMGGAVAFAVWYIRRNAASASVQKGPGIGSGFNYAQATQPQPSFWTRLRTATATPVQGTAVPRTSGSWFGTSAPATTTVQPANTSTAVPVQQDQQTILDGIEFAAL